MLTRRTLLISLGAALVFPSFLMAFPSFLVAQDVAKFRPETVQAEVKLDPVQAFEKLVPMIRSSHPNFKKDDFDKIRPLIRAAGFDVLLNNALITFDKQNGVARKVVMVYPKEITYTTGLTVAEQIFHSVEDAVAAIYGVNSL